MTRKTRKIIKRIENLNKTINSLVLTDIYRIFHPNNRKYILLNCTRNIFEDKSCPRA